MTAEGGLNSAPSRYIRGLNMTRIENQKRFRTNYVLLLKIIKPSTADNANLILRSGDYPLTEMPNFIELDSSIREENPTIIVGKNILLKIIEDSRKQALLT